jgi:hypothetical protein
LEEDFRVGKRCGTAQRVAELALAAGSGNRDPLQAVWLRDIARNPFTAATAPVPDQRSSEAGLVRSLAAAAYANHAVDRPPILADALEDAGCTDAELLGHLRGPGPHCRGSCAADLSDGRS